MRFGFHIENKSVQEHSTRVLRTTRGASFSQHTALMQVMHKATKYTDDLIAAAIDRGRPVVRLAETAEKARWAIADVSSGVLFVWGMFSKPARLAHRGAKVLRYTELGLSKAAYWATGKREREMNFLYSAAIDQMPHDYPKSKGRIIRNGIIIMIPEDNRYDGRRILQLTFAFIQREWKRRENSRFATIRRAWGT